MKCPSRTVVVVPCLNEAAAIERLVTAIRRQIAAVIVVDDGSSDRTGELAARAGAEVIRHATPRGKGAALQQAWSWGLDHGFEWALTMDGDGQHSPEDIPGFIEAADQGTAKLIVGNRMARPAGMPWLRRQVNRWMSRRLSRLAGQALPDTQCGFRMMHLRTWASFSLETTHFEIESELLLAFAQGGHAIQFVPIRVIYQDEQSKIRPLTDTYRWFRWLGQRRLKGERT